MDRDEIEAEHRKRMGYIGRGEAGEGDGWNEPGTFYVVEDLETGVPDGVFGPAVVGACWTGEPPEAS